MPPGGHNDGGSRSMKQVAMGTEAAALAATLARVQVVSAYPITPQTVIVENLAEIIGRGELDANYIPVESEHTAMASCIGASLVGARAFTASSSQGLAYMHEMLHYASGARVPVVMVNCNRAACPPLEPLLRSYRFTGPARYGLAAVLLRQCPRCAGFHSYRLCSCRTGVSAGHDQP